MSIEHIQDSTAVTTVRPGRYRLDSELTTVAFAAKKFGLFTVRGSLDLVEGTFTVADPIELSSLHAVLAADSFRTPMDNRDKHVKGKSLLDVATYPFIEFDSTAVATVAGAWEIRGLLSVHGRVAPAVLSVTAASPQGELVHVGATARVDRRVFGVTGMRAAASSHVDVRIEAVGTPVGDRKAGA